MNNDQQQNLTKERKGYQKPQVIQIPLRPDEAVLGFCKSTNAGGPGNRNICIPGICQGSGS